MNTLLTIIESAKQEASKLLEENKGLAKRVADLEDEVLNATEKLSESIDLSYCNTCSTSLGTLYIRNVSGNLALQQEIDFFLEAVKEKYC